MPVILKMYVTLVNELLTLSLQVNEEDVSQFDSKFTKQTPVDSPDDSMLSESANQIFLVSSCQFLLYLCLSSCLSINFILLDVFNYMIFVYRCVLILL